MVLMQLTRPAPVCVATSGTTSRRSAQLKCSAHRDISRRSALAGLVTVPTLFAASRALARDADKALAAKEERKAKLAKAAEEMRETGKTEAAFADSSYAVSEDKVTLSEHLLHHVQALSRQLCSY